MEFAEATLVQLSPGTKITPSLELVRPLGSGGMGHVWIAYHHGLRAEVVVKFISDHLAADPEAVARFSREAAAASRVKSPHVVHMIDHGVASDGRLFIAMELLEGFDLAALLAQRGRVSATEVIAIVSQVARALAKAHEAGIVHRDIKPENIFLLDAGGGELFVKVLDFGVAKSMFSAVGRGTATGAMVGTPFYMAPEQILGARSITPGVDIWALGVVAFEALSGTQPFNGETVGAISVAICSGPIPSLSARNPALPVAVDAWFQRACAREEQARFTNVMEMAEALRLALASAPAQAAPPSAPPIPVRAASSTTNGGTASRAGARSLLPASRSKWVVPAAVAAFALVGATVGIVAFAFSQPTAEEPEPPRHKRSKAASAKEPTDPQPASSTPSAEPSTSASASAAPATSASSPASSKATAPLPTTPTATTTTSTSAAPTAKPAPTSPATKKKNVVIE